MRAHISTKTSMGYRSVTDRKQAYEAVEVAGMRFYDAIDPNAGLWEVGLQDAQAAFVERWDELEIEIGSPFRVRITIEKP